MKEYKVVRIKFNKDQWNRLQDHMSRILASTPSDAIRDALRFRMENLERLDARKPLGDNTVFRQRKTQREEVLAMNDTDITEHFRSTGYIEPDWPVDGRPDSRNWARQRIITKQADESRWLITEYYEKSTGKIYSVSDNLTLSQVLKECNL